MLKMKMLQEVLQRLQLLLQLPIALCRGAGHPCCLDHLCWLGHGLCCLYHGLALAEAAPPMHHHLMMQLHWMKQLHWMMQLSMLLPQHPTRHQF